MSNLHCIYLSTLGTICVVPRPGLAGYDSKDGKPVAVYYPDTNFAKGRRYPDVLGIRVCDYEKEKPVMVIFELGDGSLLAASKEVLEVAARYESRAWQGHKSINPQVSQLQVLDRLPEALEIPVYNF